MQTFNNLFSKLYSFENLLTAFDEAKKSKTSMRYVIRFNKNLKENLLKLQKELRENTYQPHPLKNFL